MAVAAGNQHSQVP
jgi:hypothetical protein